MKRIVETTVDWVRRRARGQRAQVFLQSFQLQETARILDLGSEDGSNIASILACTRVSPSNVYIADIDEAVVRRGHEKFGFIPVQIPESGTLPFDDGFFDIVYCSSVIEHVTVPKAEIWSLLSGSKFKREAWRRQMAFASEIRRLGKGYFVQTPYKWFPVESHTWLPLVGYLPRRVLVPVIRMSNRVWIKGTAPDWALLTFKEMRALFPEALFVSEKFLGIPKSIMAVKELRQ